jgi:hypothetical protein
MRCPALHISFWLEYPRQEKERQVPVRAHTFDHPDQRIFLDHDFDVAGLPGPKVRDDRMLLRSR